MIVLAYPYKGVHAKRVIPCSFHNVIVVSGLITRAVESNVATVEMVANIREFFL